MKRPIVVGLSLLMLSGCAQTLSEVNGPEYAAEDLNKDVKLAVNRNAEQNGLGQGQRVESADCEDVPDIKKGAISDCNLTMRDGSEMYVRVTFQDDAGHFLVNAV